MKRVALINYPTSLGPGHRGTRKRTMMMLMMMMMMVMMMVMMMLMMVMMMMMRISGAGANGPWGETKD